LSVFTFFQLRSSGYAPSKRQKLTKNQPVLPPAEIPEQALKQKIERTFTIKGLMAAYNHQCRCLKTAGKIMNNQ